MCWVNRTYLLLVCVVERHKAWDDRGNMSRKPGFASSCGPTEISQVETSKVKTQLLKIDKYTEEEQM